MMIFMSLAFVAVAVAEAPLPHPARNITGVMMPYIIPADVADNETLTVIVRGVGFGKPEDQPSDLVCHAKQGDWNGLPDPRAKGPAKVLNDTAIACTLSGANVAGPVGIAVESPSHSDPKKKVWWSHGGSRGEWRTLVEATPDRRPYLSSQVHKAELLLAVDREAIRRFPDTQDAKFIKVCANLSADEHNPFLPASAVLPASLDGLQLLPCRELEIDGLRGGDGQMHWSGQDVDQTNGEHAGSADIVVVSLPMDATALEKLPSKVAAASIIVTASVGDFALAPKRRAFVVAPAEGKVAGQSFTAVDHKRRMVRIDDKPWLGAGFYYSSLMKQKDTPKGAKKVYVPDIDNALGHMHEFAQQGLTQVMPYGLDALSPDSRAEFLAGIEAISVLLPNPSEGPLYMNTTLVKPIRIDAPVKFDMPLVSDVEKILKSEVGSFNFTSAWNSMIAKVDSVKHSKALLGYYICDDCDNTASFPPVKMAQLYQALKAYDPFHIVIGAPWAYPFAIYTYGESAGALSLDYLQVENYHPNPSYHMGDVRIRAGMFFEPIANSPPAYLLQGLGGDPREGPAIFGGKIGEAAPPQLETTLSWLGEMQFAAANIVNFMVGSDYRWGSPNLSSPDHINAQGAYARAATLMLPAVLPDLTDSVAGSRLQISVRSTSPCKNPDKFTLKSGKVLNFATDSSVAAVGLQQRWGSGSGEGGGKFCGFLVVSNLCGAPSEYTLELEGDEVPASARMGTHLFNSNYNVTLATSGDKLLVSDTVGSYETSILRLGCDGWK